MPGVLDLTDGLAHAGLDLAATFVVQRYNDQVATRHRLPEFGHARTQGLVVGNSRELWAPFLHSLAHDSRGLRSLHPLDRYVEVTIREALAGLGVRHQVRWAHARLSRPVAIQRAAYVAGLALPAPCRLAIHPRFGLWIGLRAAIAFDCPWDDGLPTSPPTRAHPCDGCDRPCVAAFEHAVLATEGQSGCDASGWLAVREACPLASDQRYDEGQIRYHYTKDRAVLREAVASLRPSTFVR